MDEEQLDRIQKDFLMGGSYDSNNHIGLNNCYKRFNLMYGDKVNFCISSKSNQGTSISIRINKDGVLIKDRVS